MLEVIAKYNSVGICHISARGHSGFASSGYDIVCAAVSTLMQALHVGLTDVLQLGDVSLASDPEIPVMCIEWVSDDYTAQKIAQTMLLSIKAVANSYPDFVVVYEEEYIK